MRRVDRTGWLKSKWNRSRSSLTRRRLAAESSPRARYHDLAVAAELFEDRCLLANIAWAVDASVSWNNGANWSTGVVPTAADDVVIDRAAGDFTITLSSGTAAAHSIQATEAVIISGGTLTVDAASDLNRLTISGGTLNGAGDVTLSGLATLDWTSGTMSGAGRTIIAAGGTLNLSGTGQKFLNRVLENNGASTWTGGSWRMTGGTFQNNGTFTANSTGTLSSWGDGGTNAFQNAGTFAKQVTGTTEFIVSSTGVTFNNTGTVDVQAGTLRLAGRTEPVNQFTDYDVEIQDRAGPNGFSIFDFGDVIGRARG